MKTIEANPAYRPDIQGLRALAVLAVVGFHAVPEFVTGGFTGVDIFFVISGFLISQIIRDNLEQGIFTFGEFYARRIRRLFPALILVVSVVLFTGWYMLFPDEFKQIGKHGAAGAGFIDNFILWSEAGYFDEAAKNKPFLHLWSLGVEEQFYLLWPMVLSLFFKTGRKSAPIALALCFCFSFTLACYQAHFDPDAAFYLPFARFWEFMAGAAIVIFPVLNVKKTARLALSMSGFVLLVSTIFFLKDKTGVYAMLPVCGTVMILCAGKNSWPNRVILSNRPMIMIGQASYPFYLWHWPILSYMHILKLDQSAAITALAMVVAFCLAWLTFRYVEMPFRLKPATRYAFPLLAEAALIAMTGVIIYAGYLQPRLNYKEINLVLAARDDWAYPPPGIAPDFFEGLPVYRLKGKAPDEVLYLGDSNMEQYAPRIAEIIRTSNNTYSATFFTEGGCRPIPNIANDAKPECLQLMPTAMKYIDTHKVRRLVIAGLWSSGLFGNTLYYHFPDQTRLPLSDKKARLAAMKDLTDFIKILIRKDIDVILIQGIPGNASKENMLAVDRMSLLLKKNTADSLARSYPKVWRKFAVDENARDLIFKAAQESNAKIIDPVEYLCGPEFCDTLYGDHKYMYKDENHLAASYVAGHASFMNETVFVSSHD